MTEETINGLIKSVNSLDVQPTIIHPLLNNNKNEECETAEEAVTTDSEEYLSEPLRYRHFQYSTSSNNSNITLTPHYLDAMEENDNFVSCLNGMSFSNIEIPIVGYEVMEERARFTVYKLRVENKMTGDCWFVFRRYTDFVRLCNKLKHSYPHVVHHLPRKRWLGNNFDPLFLEERVNGLQTLVNAILRESELVNSQQIQDFFCLNEPPAVLDTNQESRAMFVALEDTVYQLKKQLKEKEVMIDTLQDSLHSKVVENENLKKIIRNSTMNCQKCQKDYENISRSLNITAGASSTADSKNGSSPTSSTSSNP
ncbi:hypothetical protein ILUMI_03349 [Ignelater luminosus]|uniref:PX domain-containing protein n=1 Tax=Ignelater luminosus TaxID=2038154 RepID=A0A8K0GIE5_IGNLU|nr:hypothetical protein ILUMI_03349 [Ignelater luminosus]